MSLNNEDAHHVHLREQFTQRIWTFEHAAKWMLSPDLIKAQRDVIGHAPAKANLALDLCCGTGIVGRNLLDLDWQMKGLDRAPEMGFVASEYFPVKIGSVERIDLLDSSYDLATMRQSLMLVNGSRAFYEIHRVLRPGGRFVLIQGIAFSDLDNVVYAQVDGVQGNQRTFYRREDLRRMMTDHGFNVIKERELSVRESVDHWLTHAPELTRERRERMREKILNAGEGYQRARRVSVIGGEIVEDWNWLILVGQKS